MRHFDFYLTLTPTELHKRLKLVRESLRDNQVVGERMEARGGMENALGINRITRGKILEREKELVQALEYLEGSGTK